MLSGGNVFLPTLGALRALRTELFRVAFAFATPLRPFARLVFFAAILPPPVERLSSCRTFPRLSTHQSIRRAGLRPCVGRAPSCRRGNTLATSRRRHHGQCVRGALPTSAVGADETCGSGAERRAARSRAPRQARWRR